MSNSRIYGDDAIMRKKRTMKDFGTCERSNIFLIPFKSFTLRRIMSASDFLKDVSDPPSDSSSNFNVTAGRETCRLAPLAATLSNSSLDQNCLNATILK